MIYKLVLTEEAEKQLLQWRKSGQKKDFQKILSLFQELEKHPDYRNRSGRSSQRKSFRLLEPEN